MRTFLSCHLLRWDGNGDQKQLMKQDEDVVRPYGVGMRTDPRRWGGNEDRPTRMWWDGYNY